MYDAGINKKDIQRMSGHTTADMTRHNNKSIKTLEDEKSAKFWDKTVGYTCFRQ